MEAAMGTGMGVAMAAMVADMEGTEGAMGLAMEVMEAAMEGMGVAMEGTLVTTPRSYHPTTTLNPRLYRTTSTLPINSPWPTMTPRAPTLGLTSDGREESGEASVAAATAAITAVMAVAMVATADTTTPTTTAMGDVMDNTDRLPMTTKMLTVW